MAKRDSKLTMAQRNARAYAQGYRGARGGEAGAYAAARKARAAGEALPSDVTARPDLRQVIRLPGGRRIVTPRGGRAEAVAQAQAREGDRFSVTATVNGQQVKLFSRGGWKASELRKAIADHGSVVEALAYLISSGEGLTDGQGGSLGMGETSAADIDSYQLDLM